MALIHYRWRIDVLIVGLFSLSLLGNPCPVQGASEKEYSIKAAFLYHFAQFVTWPTEKVDLNNPTVLFCLYGTNPFGDTVLKGLEGKKIQDRTFSVTMIHNLSDVHHCHMLFLGTTKEEWVKTIKPKITGEAILTIAEFSGFPQQGGMIQFFITENKVRFAINPVAVGRARLQMSSKLLRLATIIGKEGS